MDYQQVQTIFNECYELLQESSGEGENAPSSNLTLAPSVVELNEEVGDNRVREAHEAGNE